MLKAAGNQSGAGLTGRARLKPLTTARAAPFLRGAAPPRLVSAPLSTLPSLPLRSLASPGGATTFLARGASGS